MKRDGIVKELIIFDLDGTLVDSKEDLASSLNHTLETFERPPLSREFIFSHVGCGVSHLILQALEDDGDSLFSSAIEFFLQHYEEHLLDSTHPYPGVMESLEENRPFFTYAMFTNKPLYLTEKIMEQFGFRRFFPLVLGGDTVKKKKPHPEGVATILEQTGTPAKHAVIVGDSMNDILAGRRSGIEVVGGAYGIGSGGFV